MEGFLMKTFSLIAKIVAALAAVAGIVYVVATYGDKIVAWAKNLLGKFSCCCGDDCECDCECKCDAECEDCPCESDCDECPCCCECEEAAEEDSTAEEAAEEAPAEAVSAEESDFEG